MLLHAWFCCHLNKATKAMWTVLERWHFKQYLFFFFFCWRSLPNRPLSISFDYPHAKIQIPQDTNSLSQNNYKMLDATVNTTSVTVTVCICHEMRQKQNEFALMNRIREEAFFRVACWLCYRRLFQPHHKWALMFHTGFAVEESKFVWVSCLPIPFSVWKMRDTIFFSFFFLSHSVPFFFSSDDTSWSTKCRLELIKEFKKICIGFVKPVLL